MDIDEKPIINYIFSCGFRCYSTSFLNSFNLRKMSSPFDWMIIDLETVFKIINSKFIDFFNDIVVVDTACKTTKINNIKNFNKVDKSYNLLIDKGVQYLKINYSNNKIFLNQNYTNNINTNNIYYLNNVCEFRHFDITKKTEYYKINNRCKRFKLILDKYENNTALFYITRIFNDKNNIREFILNTYELKKKYNINSYLIVIVYCSDNISKSYILNNENKCLFILKKCDTLNKQLKINEIENEHDLLNYDLIYGKEYEIMNKIYNFQIVELENLKNEIIGNN